MQQKDLDRLFRRCDREDGADRQCNIRITTSERTLLRQTAKAANATQAGTLRVGLQLVAEAVAQQVAGEAS